MFPYASVTASYSRKVNLGNYQSEDYFCSMNHSWLDHEPDDAERAQMYRKLVAQCKAEVMAQVTGHKQNDDDGAHDDLGEADIPF